MIKGVKKIIEIFKEKEFKVLIKNNKIPFVSGVSDFEILQAFYIIFEITFFIYNA